MTNRNEWHEQYLAMTKKVAEEILGEMRKEISGNQHDQMDSIVQDVSTRIVEWVNKIDEELEQRINDAKKRFQWLPQKFLDASIKVDSNAFQQRRNTIIDI